MRSEDYVEHVELPPGFPQGRDGLKALVTMVRAAFPDFHYLIEDEIAEGARYVLRCTAQGTHKGDFSPLVARHGTTGARRCPFVCTLADVDIANFAWVVPATVFCLIAILVAAHRSPAGSTFKARLWFCSVEINKDPITGRVGVEVVDQPDSPEEEYLGP